MDYLNDREPMRLRHADDCECEDCHEHDPLNGPRNIFIFLIAMIIALMAAGLFYFRLFG